ncbi:hypothetical protein [Rhodoferax aquaticus]|uniref:Uncharacterized protein n=1 Tax=Rhodoferax aquaticus TaxID=2527691 RepID=A0A515EU86_9BURK|nr:hypothetical protein [Rhodoferax aquaticus]QDL56178.1 hypothetical protein EXZ61_19555 [Rhodoferax aquaticus]
MDNILYINTKMVFKLYLKNLVFFFCFLPIEGAVQAQIILDSMVARKSKECDVVANAKVKDKFKQLSAISTPTELVKFIKLIHDKFLLLEPSFAVTVELDRLFASTPLKQTWPFKVPDDSKWMKTEFAPDSALAGTISFRTEEKNWWSGNIHYVSQLQNSGFNFELVERELGPYIVGADPFGKGFIPPNLETLDSATRRPPARNSHGYFEYIQVNSDARCKSHLMVRLNADGNVRDIDLKQEKF